MKTKHYSLASRGAGTEVSDDNPLPVAIKSGGASGSGAASSTSNSSTTILPAGETFVGVGEENDFTDVMVSCQTDQPGTLNFEFSVDGTNWGSFPVGGFEVVAGIHEFHTAVKGPRFFRVSLTNTGGSDQTFLRLQTYYGTFAKPNAPLGQNINDDSDATVVKSVVVGITPSNTYRNQPVSGTAFSTTTNLAASETFDSGFLELSKYQQVQTHILSSHDGTIQISFAADSAGTDIVRSLTIPYRASTGFQLFSAPAFADYVRYEFTNDAGVTTTDLLYETKFLINSLSGQLLGLNASLSPSMVANLGRNVIVGRDSAGNFRNVPTDTEGNLKINVHEPTTAFGDLRTSELTPQAQITFAYSINADIVDTDTLNGGTVTQADSMAVLQTSTDAAGSAQMNSRRILKYRSGLGASVRFTGMWESSAADSTQLLGVGDTSDGFFLGYNGTSFGLMSRQNETDTWIGRAAWNIDTMDGAGNAGNPSGVLLDTTKLNVFQIRFQWLGAGQVEYAAEDPTTGRFVPVHRIQYANNYVLPSIYNPSLPLHGEVVNQGNTTNLVVKTASMAAFVEGRSIVTGPSNAYQASSTHSTETAFFHLRNKGTYQSLQNRVSSIVRQLSVGNDANTLSTFRMYLNATLSGTAAWADINGADSVMEVDQVQAYVSGGKLLFAGTVGKDTGVSFPMSELDINIRPNDVLTVTSASGSSGAQSASIVWVEDF